ncbi:MAG TPA: ABC transporter ATP-binding protein [Acidimicrobiia bacterium]|nr:ABC transporter ATP-binding protein [Acidimicrobiia bacterium]
MPSDEEPAVGPIVEMRSISKVFGDTVANNPIDFDVRAGEIHVLLGENGAGKTTLMNILFGHMRPDAGTILLRGQPVDIQSPSDAIAHGIGMVHQHFSLVPSFTVAENVMLGVRRASNPVLRDHEIEAAVARRSERLQMPIDASVLVEELPVDLQQRVEIVKAMYRDATVLILDEPTSLLGPTQIANLLGILSNLRDLGHSIILVTHKLAEVVEVADRVTVLRRGSRVSSMERGQFDERSLARAMTGQDREKLPERASIGGDGKAPSLVISELTVRAGRGDAPAIDGLSLSVYPGEILGIAGVEGNGQRELVDTLMGISPAASGSVSVSGHEVTSATPAARRAAGLGVIPEDRQGLGLVLDMTLAENIALADVAAGKFRRRGVVQWDDVRDHARRLLEEYDVRPPDPDVRAGSLSGGNQQKVVLARELSSDPTVLVADNPTWGLDVGAIDYVHLRLLRLRDEGGAILLITLDLEELYKLADRIAVIYRGKLMLVSPASQVDDDDLAMAMAGRSLQSTTRPELSDG